MKYIFYFIVILLFSNSYANVLTDVDVDGYSEDVSSESSITYFTTLEAYKTRESDKKKTISIDKVLDEKSYFDDSVYGYKGRVYIKDDKDNDDGNSNYFYFIREFNDYYFDCEEDNEEYDYYECLDDKEYNFEQTMLKEAFDFTCPPILVPAMPSTAYRPATPSREIERTDYCVPYGFNKFTNYAEANDPFNEWCVRLYDNGQYYLNCIFEYETIYGIDQTNFQIGPHKLIEPFKKPDLILNENGVCPKGEIDLFNETYVFDVHCKILSDKYNDYRNLFKGIYSVVGAFIIFYIMRL